MQNLKNEKSKFEGKNIHTLFRNLGCQNENTRLEARETVVAMGGKAVDFLREAVLASNPNLKLSDSVFSVEKMRKESLLALIDIADPVAAPLFFYALEDKDSTVRWLGEEGFITLGEKGLIFLLHSLQKVSIAEELRKGMHQDRKSVVQGKSVDLGRRRTIKKKKKK